MRQVVNFKCSNQSSTTGASFSNSTTSATSSNGDIFFESEPFVECEIGKYSVFDIADWFLKKGNMTQKKLQKMCYYAQAWTSITSIV